MTGNALGKPMFVPPTKPTNEERTYRLGQPASLLSRIGTVFWRAGLTTLTMPSCKVSLRRHPDVLGGRTEKPNNQ